MNTPAAGAVTLAELRPALTLFAAAIAGRAVTLREQTAAHRGCAPHVQPPTIGLPALVDTFADRRDNRSAYRVAVLREAIGLEEGALPLGDVPASVLWRRLFRTLDRLRIHHAIARRYAGARDDLARVNAHALAQRPALVARRAGAPRVLEALQQLALGAPPATLRAPGVPVDTLLSLGNELARADATAADSANAASRLCDAIAGARWRNRAQARRDAFATASAAAAPPSAASGHRGAANNKQARSTAANAQAGSAHDAHGELAGTDAADTTATWPAPHAWRRVALPPRHDARPGPAATATSADDSAGQRYHVDEWDCHQQRHRLDWCTVIEQRLGGDDGAFMHGVCRRHAALRRDVHRRFAALRPEALQRVHGVDDGDELELDRVVEALVDRRAGHSTSCATERALYLRRDRLQRDVSTVFLVDTSASTDHVLRDPAAPAAAAAVPPAHDDIYLYDPLPSPAAASAAAARRVIDVAKDALALMCDALQTLGDPFAVYAFSGHGRHHVDFRVVKDFHDAVSSHTAAALSALRPQGATRAGAAIRHASAKLLRQPQRLKVLIVVSDGYPEDVDYGPEPRELRYGIEDTAHALQEAEALGVSTFNLSIDPAGHDYLRRMCPAQRYMVIGDVAALPGELTKVYQAMTRAAG